MERLPELDRSMDEVRQELSRMRVAEERLERISDVTSVHDSRLDAFRVIVQELRGTSEREQASRWPSGIWHGFAKISSRQFPNFEKTFRMPIDRYLNSQRCVPKPNEPSKQWPRSRPVSRSLQHAGMLMQAMEGLPNLVATPTAAGTIFNEDGALHGDASQ